MYLQIKKAQLIQNEYGKNDIKITMIGLYDDDGKRIRRVKINENSLEILLSGKNNIIGPNNKSKVL